MKTSESASKWKNTRKPAFKLKHYSYDQNEDQSNTGSSYTDVVSGDVSNETSDKKESTNKATASDSKKNKSKKGSSKMTTSSSTAVIKSEAAK